MLKTLRKYRFYLILSVIVLLAALLRFPFLDVFPPSMIQDEVGIGYSAISIAETGKDEWGISYPLVFKSFGDYKAPAFIYTTALLYKVIGWQEVLPRMTSALAGLIIVLSGGLWAKKLFKSEELGLVAALLLAVNPWTIHLSRMALESNLGLAFFMLGLLCMSYASKSQLKVFLSALFFSLSTYSFHSFRYTVVLFLGTVLVATVVVHGKKIKKQLPFLKTTGLILILSTLLALPGFLSKGATSRLDQTLLFTSEKHISLYEHYENNCHSTFITINPKLTVLCRLKYNKFSRLALIGTDSLMKHLSPGFYFFAGDTEPVRNPTGTGEFYAILFPIWMLGMFILIREYKKYFVLLVGYGVALLPSIVSGDPHATRLSVVIPFFLMTIVLGYKFLKDYFRQHAFFTPIFILLLLVSTSFFVVKYASDTFAEHEITGTYLSYAKKVARLSHEYVQKGYRVYADHDLYPEPHMYYAYWNQIDPVVTQESFMKVYEESAGFSRPKQFGDALFFEGGNSATFDCTHPSAQPIVIFTNDAKENTVPTKIIKDTTELYSFVYVYELAGLCPTQDTSQ